MSSVLSPFGVSRRAGGHLIRLALLAIMVALLLLPLSAFAAEVDGGSGSRDAIFAVFGGLAAQIVVAVLGSAVIYPRVRMVDQQDARMKKLEDEAAANRNLLTQTRVEAAQFVQRSEIDAIRREVRAEVTELRTELRAEVGQLRAGLDQLRSDVATANKQLALVFEQNSRIISLVGGE